VDIIPPQGAIRWPKKKPLPIEQITQLASEGLRSKAIASRLKKNGVIVSYKTIQRVLLTIT